MSEQDSTNQQNSSIPDAPTSLTDTAEFNFRFKEDNLGNKRPNVELKLPVVNVAGLINILRSGDKKQIDLIFSSMYDTYRGAIGSYVGDKEDVTQDSFPVNDFTWEKIANMERAERKTISKESWDAFAKSYMAVMPSVTGKDAEKIANSVQVFLKKFTLVKSNKPVIQMLQQQLALYMENAKDAKDHEEILDVLNRRAEAYLKSDDVEQLVANL